MPVKPENVKRYPPDWKQIRQEVLERAGHKCEQCGVRNHVWRNKETGAIVDNVMGGNEWKHWTYIVLTVAHLNHNPSDCGEPGNRPNLKALCQRDHLAWDLEHHQRNSWHTRRAKKQTAELF